MRHSSVAAVGTTWLRLVQGSQGWTALPRLAAWLCVPAIIALLILIFSLLRRWRLQVLGVLWLLVTVAMGTTFPAVDVAMRNWMVLHSARQDH